MSDLLTALRDGLAQRADPATAPGMQAYMKSTMPYRGVATPEVRRVLREVVAELGPPTDRPSWEATVRQLWDDATYREERYVAVDLCRVRSARAWQDADAVPLYDHFVVTGAWWDHVDAVAIALLGPILRTHREAVEPVVRDWISDPDRWRRRTSIILQNGALADTDTSLLADAILASADDRDFFLRKGIGWALREYAKSDAAWVRGFVAAHSDRLSPLSRHARRSSTSVERSSTIDSKSSQCDGCVSTWASGVANVTVARGGPWALTWGSTTRSAADVDGRDNCTSNRRGSPDHDRRHHDVPATRAAVARWHRITRHVTTRLGAFGATAAVLIGACGPAATQCAPPLPGPAATTTTTTLTTTTSLSPPTVGSIVLASKPVQAPCTYTDTWGAARSGGRVHLGTDIMASEGQEVYAVQSGQITKLYSQATDALAGNGIRLNQPDGTFYFYGHMSALAPGIVVGTTVTAGQLVGWVGHTGNAGVNHLHLEIHPSGGAAVNSYPILVASGGAC